MFLLVKSRTIKINKTTQSVTFQSSSSHTHIQKTLTPQSRRQVSRELSWTDQVTLPL